MTTYKDALNTAQFTALCLKGASFSCDVITKYCPWQDESESEEGLVWEGLIITLLELKYYYKHGS